MIVSPFFPPPPEGRAHFVCWLFSQLPVASCLGTSLQWGNRFVLCGGREGVGETLSDRLQSSAESDQLDGNSNRTPEERGSLPEERGRGFPLGKHTHTHFLLFFLFMYLFLPYWQVERAGDTLCVCCCFVFFFALVFVCEEKSRAVLSFLRSGRVGAPRSGDGTRSHREVPHGAVHTRLVVAFSGSIRSASVQGFFFLLCRRKGSPGCPWGTGTTWWTMWRTRGCRCTTRKLTSMGFTSKPRWNNLVHSLFLASLTPSNPFSPTMWRWQVY